MDPTAVPDLEAACAVLEEAEERTFLPSFLTSLGMVLALTAQPHGIDVLHKALSLTRDTGQTSIENWALQTICSAHLFSGDLDEAARFADELAAIGRSRNDEDGMAQALTLGARIRFMRGDLAEARTMYADAAALARTRSAAWPRALALCGLASVTLAIGDEEDARANIEEALLHCGGLGFIRIDSMCGALALLLEKAGEHERALAVFRAVAPDTEDAGDFIASSADPSEALRKATREARALLGNPPAVDAGTVDLEAMLRAAFDDRREPTTE
jgi:tetratricopeptide (TPR) repeat protein